MRKAGLIAICTILLLTTAGGQEEVIDKDKVIRMAKSGFDDDEIIAIVKSAKKVDFVVTEESVLALKQAGVSKAVIKALVDNRQTAAAAPSAPALKSAEPDRQRLTPDGGLETDGITAGSPRFPSVFVEEVTPNGQVVTSSENLTEAIKTLHKKRMRLVTIRDRADYVLRVAREEGKKSWRKDVKVVLSDRDGNVVYANSTRSIGGAAGDVADFILTRQQ